MLQLVALLQKDDAVPFTVLIQNVESGSPMFVELRSTCRNATLYALIGNQ